MNNVNNLYASNIKCNSFLIELTDCCPNGCNFCYNTSGIETSFLDFNDLIKIFQCAKKIGYTEIFLSGGEPFTYKYFNEAIDYCNDLSLKTTIITSFGDLLTDNLINKIIDYKIGIIATLDSSNAKIHDGRRKLKCFEKTVNSIKRLYDKGFKNKMAIRCNLSYDNIEYIEDIIKFVISLKVNNITFSMLFNGGRAKDIRYLDQKHDSELLKKIGETISKLAKLYENDITVEFHSPLPYACSHVKLLEGFDTPFSIKITNDGSIFSCHMLFDKNYSLGDIKCDDLYNIIFNGKLFEQMALWKKRKEGMIGCEKCKVNRFCQGGCPAYGLSLNNNLSCQDDLCDLRRNNYLNMFGDVMRNINNGK